MSTREIVLPVQRGLDLFKPAIQSFELEFSELNNLAIRNQRLVPADGYRVFQSGLPSAVSTITSYTDIKKNSVELYALLKDSYYRFNAGNSAFEKITFDVPSTVEEEPYCAVSWDDALYASRIGVNLGKLQKGVHTEVDSHWRSSVTNSRLSARYGINHTEHLVLANVQEIADQVVEGNTVAVATRLPKRIRWSDLGLPEDFEISISSEADFFDLESTDLEITGLSVQRDHLLIYSRSSVWRGVYFGRPIVYRFEPLIRGTGNVFHHSLISVEGSDYFIGRNNFFRLNETGLTRIGDRVWQKFQSTQDNLQLNDPVRALSDPDRNEIIWVYRSNMVVDGTSLVGLKYNYWEDQWSFVSGSSVITMHNYLSKPSAFVTIDDPSITPQLINHADWANRLIDGPWANRSISFNSIVGDLTGNIHELRGSVERGVGRPVSCMVQTHEFVFDSLKNEKAISQIVLSYAQQGIVPIRVQVSLRDNPSEITVPQGVQVITDQIPGESSIFTINDTFGKYLSIRIWWDNTENSYVKEFYGLALDVVGFREEDVEQ